MDIAGIVVFIGGFIIAVVGMSQLRAPRESSRTLAGVLVFFGGLVCIAMGFGLLFG